MSNFSSNENIPYYPESLNFNAQTQSFQRATNENGNNSFSNDNSNQNFASSNQQTSSNGNSNIFSNLFSSNGMNNILSNPLFNLLKNKDNPLSNLMGGNGDMMSTLASNLFGVQGNNIMQALNLFSPKNKKQSEEHKNKIIDIENSFEEM